MDTRRGYSNPEGKYMAQQSQYDSEQAKLKEELQNIEAELEESKFDGVRVAAQITHPVDKDYSEPHGGLHEPQDEVAEDDPDSRSVFVKNVDFSADE
jgi:hypothetical protein